MRDEISNIKARDNPPKELIPLCSSVSHSGRKIDSALHHIRQVKGFWRYIDSATEFHAKMLNSVATVVHQISCKLCGSVF